jgi:tetratricopeptide (TPR) repeat protein
MIVRRLLSLLLGSVLAAPLTAQAPRLGTISFPTSGSPPAQERFIEGVLFLHSFEYESAARAFRAAQEIEPDFAMAYWGEAMTYNHPLWGQWDDSAASGALGRLGETPAARRAKAGTERERMYLEAVEALWADGPKPQRDTAYAEAMERLVHAFPDDDEARAFHALSLLGLSGTTRVFPSYMRAAAVAGEIFRDHPDHPGAAHYLIHSFDDPIHAPLGLPAARAYSGIAPDAAHAQHMTTHIFLALGMWDEVVSQNTIAADLTHWGPGHYTAWLGYGLLQQGKYDGAREHLERARGEMRTPPPAGQRGYLASMRAHWLVITERWTDPVASWEIDLTGAGAVSRAIDTFVVGWAALQTGNAAAARTRLAELESMRATAAEGREGAYGGNADRIAVLATELEAGLSLAAGDTDAGLRALRAAARMEDGLPLEFGPPDIVKPSHELLGETLLGLGRAGEAQTAFERALALAPNRALSLAGLARAAAAAGNAAARDRALATLRETWDEAEAGIAWAELLTQVGMR